MERKLKGNDWHNSSHKHESEITYVPFSHIPYPELSHNAFTQLQGRFENAVFLCICCQQIFRRAPRMHNVEKTTSSKSGVGKIGNCVQFRAQDFWVFHLAWMWLLVVWLFQSYPGWAPKNDAGVLVCGVEEWT